MLVAVVIGTIGRSFNNKFASSTLFIGSSIFVSSSKPFVIKNFLAFFTNPNVISTSGDSI